MNVGEYKNNKTREIIEDAISQLVAVGFTNDGAAYALVVQGVIRIDDKQKRKDAAAFVVREAADTID